VGNFGSAGDNRVSSVEKPVHKLVELVDDVCWRETALTFLSLPLVETILDTNLQIGTKHLDKFAD